MAINYNEGDKVIVNPAFVSDTLALRTTTPKRRALLAHLSRLGTGNLLVSRVIVSGSSALIKPTVIGATHLESPILVFESEDDLNNSFTLVKAFTANRHEITVINGDSKLIKSGFFVVLKGYQGSNPQIPCSWAGRSG